MKKISYILLIVMIFQVIFPLYSLYAENDEIRKLGSMSDIEISHLSDSDILGMITSSDDYPVGIEALIRCNENTQGAYDRKEYVEININTYRKYRKIVYGVPFDQQRNYPGLTIEGSQSKYLGFNNQGNAVTNDKYPGDSEGDEPPDKDWIVEENKHFKTWKMLDGSSLEDKEKLLMYDHMLNSDTINDDAIGTYTLAEILYKKMGNLNRYLKSNVTKLREELESVVELQMLPTFESDGSFVMRRLKGNRIKYDTMGWPRFGKPEEYLTIEPERKYIAMFPNQDEVENKFIVTLHMKEKLSGMDTLKLINPFIDFGLGDLSSEVESNNPTYTFTKKYKRSDYNFGINTIEEAGQYSFSSIFNDPYSGHAKCDFQLDLKLDGNINADFIINHGDIDYTEKEIFLGEGNWDSADDRVRLVLQDN